jgi:hypothetical protein
MLQRKCDCGNHAMSGNCDDCAKKKSLLQRKAAHGNESSEAPSIVNEVLRSTGQPLDPSTRAFMEPRFRHDFSNVRVHADSRAAASARAMNALAYTAGSQVVFDAGQYAPETFAGRKLLAHELTHTLQQVPSGPALMPASLQINEPNDVHEREADRVAATVMSGDRFESARLITSSSPSIQRSLHVDPPTPPTERMDSPGRAAPVGPRWWEPLLVFIVTLEKATGLKFTNQGSELILEKSNLQKTNPSESFVRRVINSQRVYRLRLGKTDLGGQPVRGASWETQGTDVVITVNPAHTGQSVWTIGELLLQEIASAVAKNDPEQTPSGSANIKTEDEMLTARLPYGSTDNSGPAEIQRLQKSTNAEVSAFVGRTLIGRLTGKQMGRIIGNASRADGVSLREIIQGVETNMPFRRAQRRVGDRVFVTYENPVGASGDQTSRKATFVPGEDATAQPLLPPGQCSAQQKQVDTNSCCTPEMLKEIGANLDIARAYTQRAIIRLESETDTTCYLKQHFGAQGTPAKKTEITSQLRTVSGELYLSRHQWKCRDAGSGQLGCRKTEVYMVGRKRITEKVGGVTPRDDITIVMCVDPPPSHIDWVSVLHEVVHRTGVAGEEKYEGGSGYPGSNALKNADSYARLAEDVGAPNLTPCKG